MTTLPSRTLAVAVERPWRAAYAFLAEPANFARWASGLGASMAEVDGRWTADGPDGPVVISFTPDNPYGVVDHRVLTPDGEVYVPMRVLANGDGCDVTVTLFRQPSMDDARFVADAEWVARDLAALKALLEAETA